MREAKGKLGIMDVSSNWQATAVTDLPAATLNDAIAAAQDNETARLVRFRWRIMFISFLLGSIAMGLSTLANVLTGESKRFYFDASFLVCVLLGTAAVVQVYLRRPLPVAERVVLLGVCILFVYQFVILINAVYDGRGGGDLFTELVPWLGVVYVAAFIIFPLRWALYLVGSLLSFVAIFWGRRVLMVEINGARYFGIEALSDTLVSSLVMVCLLYFFKRVTEVGARAEVRAVAMETLAHTDSLTGLYNRRYLSESLRVIYLRARAKKDPLTVVVCDLDHFKAINDRFSHAAGDQVLVEVAELLRSSTRQGDIVSRHGGEEFVMVLTRTSHAHALAVCEKIRQRISQHDLSHIRPELAVTASFGVCSDLNLGNHEAMLAQADKQLYVAKRAGRNRVA